MGCYVPTDLLIRHIQQSLAGDSGYVLSELKTGDSSAKKSAKLEFPTCFPHFLIHFHMFHLVFPQFLWVFPMFPQVFLPVPYFRS